MRIDRCQLTHGAALFNGRVNDNGRCDDRGLDPDAVSRYAATMEVNVMQTSIHRILIAVLLATIAAGCEKPVSYKRDIRPILIANCLQCHDGKGEGSTASGLSLQTYDSLMKGTKFGPVVEPGSAVSSTFYRVLTDGVDPKIRMPPQGEESLAQGRGEPLSDGQIKNIELWIDQGAKNN
jgi:hypothetical protein